MKKGRLLSGAPFMVVRVEHLVTETSFATALADFYWCKSEPFDTLLSKSDARDILYRGLFHNGRKGVLSDGQLESAEDIGTEYNNAYKAAIDWVRKNYPFLQE